MGCERLSGDLERRRPLLPQREPPIEYRLDETTLGILLQDGVAFFRADDTLDFVGFAPAPPQTSWGWVAVDPGGALVSSEFEDVTELRRYAIDWARLRDTGEAVISFLDFVVLQDETGAPLELEHLQGGEFADDDGSILYLSNGFLGSQDPSWGVHVFRTRSGSGAECRGLGGSCVVARRIERSHDGPGGFAYEFDPSDCVNCPREEPEGLTFWDLDADGRAPGVGGQLHVILLDNDEDSSDDVYVKHYRRSFADQTAPAIVCPRDAAAECSAHGGAPAADAQLFPFFAGVSASDNCDESTDVTNDAPGLLPLGATFVTFTAEDDFGNAAQCSAVVTVADTAPPVIECPAPASVECTSPDGVLSDDPQLAAFFLGVSATDVCDAAPAVSNDAPAVLPFGATAVTFTAMDASSNPSSCASTVHVGDTTAPAIHVSLSPSVLWPPDHRLVPITASVTVSDLCDPAASFRLVSITSNEPADGLGDGVLAPDVQGASFGTPDTSFAVRAERSGTGTGRVYTIVHRATDAAGNARDAIASVTVPLNQ
ncbi:MAG: HYR domain-containing protein [Candidatus Binatia bacterium]